MIITCPACDAQYLLPDESIGPNGRRVKCTSCSYTWLQSSKSEDEQEISYEVTETEAQDFGRRRGPTAQKSSETEVESSGLGAKTFVTGLGFAIVLFAVTLGFMVLGRDNLIKSWPPLALLYETVGMPVAAPGTGLALENVTAVLVPEDNPEKLQLKGQLVNKTNHDVSLPGLLVRASGGQGWLKDWPIPLEGKYMPGGKTVGFEYILSDLPKNMTEVAVRFAD